MLGIWLLMSLLKVSFGIQAREGNFGLSAISQPGNEDGYVNSLYAAQPYTGQSSRLFCFVLSPIFKLFMWYIWNWEKIQESLLRKGVHGVTR